VGPAIRCRAIVGVADHCFTTRAPVLGAGPFHAGRWMASRAFRWASRLIRSRPSAAGARHAASWACGGTSRFRRRGRTGNVGDIVASTMQGWRFAYKWPTACPSCWPTRGLERGRRPCRLARHGCRRRAVAVEGARRAFRRGPVDLVAAIGPSIAPFATASGRTCGRVRGGRHAGSFARRWFSRAPSVEALRVCRERTPRRRAGGGRLCSSTRGWPNADQCAPRESPPRRSTSRGCAPPATRRVPLLSGGRGTGGTG